MWRPEGWENPHSRTRMTYELEKTYEAGANAMLEALKGLPDSMHLANYDCWRIFIPDEEVL